MYTAGADGKDTAPWAIAAGMENFETFYATCWHSLREGDFKWPAGVTEVSYGFGQPIQQPTLENIGQKYHGSGV